MSASDKTRCERCGAPAPAKSAATLCPACLLSGAIEAPEEVTLSMAPGGPPVTGEPGEFPREFGGYRLLGLLGVGGMGRVYEAEQLSTGRRVALKMLSQQLDSPGMRQRFLREGRLAASVNHPNSLYVFGSEEIDSAPVITMEIAGSGTLKDQLQKRGPFPVKSAVDAILDVISGLEAAFAAGVLHRDVKPSNCFVSPDGSVKVGDFGLSVSTLPGDDSYATATGVIMGTPAYAPPEQLRGDELDVRADIYSVGATLFSLLTNRAPFEGKNAVQVVANAVNQPPKRLSDLREEVPPDLDRIVARCLAKDPEGRYADYTALRDALLPFSSRESEPASLTVRAAAGWIDYLIAFLVPYVPLMLAVGNEDFHFRFLMERTLYSAWSMIAFLGFGLLYFGLFEGIWGAGVGKRLKGLRVVRADGRPPGIARALVRILIPILSIEVVRVPLLLATITATRINDLTVSEIVIYCAACSLCPWIPVLLSLTARSDNGFATVWDLVSGTRVVLRPKGTVRAKIEPIVRLESSVEGAESLGPYRISGELVPGNWVTASDPVLRRQVWLLLRTTAELPLARRTLARSGRPRWLQSALAGESTWDAFEAIPGVSFRSLVEDGKSVPWGTLRHWLHDLASELWAASRDHTLPSELSLDHVWITEQGQALLLDEPWPGFAPSAESIRVGDVAGQQRFLSEVAACVESTSLPLHAQPVLQNLQDGKFEKLSYLTGTLRGLLERPAEVGKAVRAGSIFLFPFYVWVMIFVGAWQGAEWLYEIVGRSAVRIGFATAIAVLIGSALVQLLELPLRTTAGNSVFRLAVVNDKGQPAGIPVLFARWAIAWLPLLIPLACLALLIGRAERVAIFSAFTLLLVWVVAAVYAVVHPNRGLHDRLAGTWVVRR